MSQALDVYFHLDASNPTVGLWCPDCQQPSVIECPVVQLSLDGVGIVGTCQTCVDCDGDGEDDD